MKKLLLSLLALMLLAGCSSSAALTDEELEAAGWVLNPTENGYVDASEVATTLELPEARDTSKTYVPSEGADEVACETNNYAAGCSSITVDNLVDYLGRDDVVYIDLRDYADYASKHLKNFESVPYFALVFDASAGTDGFPQLYSGEVTAPVAVYEESDAILAQLFPEDQVIFLMCQSGGRVVNMMKLLEAKGYDMSLIYNVGGMGQYTDSSFREYTTDTGEIAIEVTYNVNGTLVD
ncbi:MAG: rhodanese-like domain-containing protein [Erysipelotrichaceae bacterium]